MLKVSRYEYEKDMSDEEQMKLIEEVSDLFMLMYNYNWDDGFDVLRNVFEKIIYLYTIVIN